MPYADLELDDEDKLDAIRPIPTAAPDYPFGLRICLTDRELTKLGLDDGCEVGDYLMMTIVARVTHCSKTDGPDGASCRVELQIEKAKALEGDEDAAEAFEDEETKEGEL